MPLWKFRFARLCAVAAFGLVVDASVVDAQQADDVMPLWAYAVSVAPQPGDTTAPFEFPAPGLRPGDDPNEVNEPRRVEGSAAVYSRMQIRDGHDVIDWFPGDHPPMPDIMRYGPASLMDDGGWGCAFCHLPNGKGRPENAPPAGQTVGYTVQQLKDMRDGLRISADPRKLNSPIMNTLAGAMTEAEMYQAAEYFAAMPWTTWIDVIETDTIPAMHLEEGNMYITVGSEPSEPLDGRIVETPVDDRQANYLRNPRSSWIAYVPTGSISRGATLVTTGAGRTIQCSVCHGSDLMGLANVPGIAGRSPSYMMRQLWDMKVGTRNGVQAALMKPVIENLSVDDMTAIVAYLAALEPPPAP